MLSKRVKEQILYCNRPQYTLSVLQSDLTRRSFDNAGEQILGRKAFIHTDETGLVWLPKDLLAPQLVDFFIKNPSKFYSAVESRMIEYCRTSELVRAAEISRNTSVTAQMKALRGLAYAYIGLLKYVIIGNLLIEEVIGRFQQLLAEFVPNELAVQHLDSLLRCDAVARAIDLQFFEDIRGTKRIEDVTSAPVHIFGDTRIVHSVPTDDNVNSFLLQAKGCISRYAPLRFIVPVVYQMAEEWRYADYSLRTHLRYYLDSLQAQLGIQKNLYAMTFSELEAEFITYECRAN
ncbi:hypothetical protein [Roseibium sp.]|uniref:hypothetical protein n=1 Tax=Roseibium sp. TaxID=1936156 RepID=UPI003B5262F4